uniref:Interleukin-7 n=1 Tax=Seriola lalandi dorsalis TaxID=1841481 RepID=A0A3B4XF29_SERLL
MSNPSPLFCISLFALLLLPLSLSCDSIRPPEEVRNDYRGIVQIELDNAVRHQFLRSKLYRWVMTNVVRTLHFLTCKMKKLRLSHTDGLVGSVINSIHCSCLEKSMKEPNTKLKTATRQRRNEQRKSKETRNLCKAKAILSIMTECYEMLNTLLLMNT